MRRTVKRLVRTVLSLALRWLVRRQETGRADELPRRGGVAFKHEGGLTFMVFGSGYALLLTRQRGWSLEYGAGTS